MISEIDEGDSPSSNDSKSYDSNDDTDDNEEFSPVTDAAGSAIPPAQHLSQQQQLAMMQQGDSLRYSGDPSMLSKQDWGSYYFSGYAPSPNMASWTNQPGGYPSESPHGTAAELQGTSISHPGPDLTHLLPPDHEYKVYTSRWIMLGYMSMLNLLSDWTCYSIAPIALLTRSAFGDVDPESLVTVFLGANAMASALEPAILGRLGLRRTVVFGAMICMLGSIIKSGGMETVLTARSMSKDQDLLEEEAAGEVWRLYVGFFLVGLSQPLYQCTPALLSASWFPENERTMATGVALNSNQLGIGCAFVFGIMLVHTEEDILPYFGLLSAVATVTFVGCAMQFDDAPPTPPSDSARVMKGSLEIKIPKFSFLGLGRKSGSSASPTKLEDEGKKGLKQEDGKGEVHAVVESDGLVGAVVGAPSPASGEEPVETGTATDKKAESDEGLPPPAPAQPYQQPHAQQNHPLQGGPPPSQGFGPPGPYPGPPYMMPPPPPGYYASYQPVHQEPGMGYSNTAPSFYHGYDQQGHYHNALLESNGYNEEYDQFAGDDEGVEPIMTQLDRQLDIDIRDDQLIQQVKACFRRKGFAHCVVAFTTSGIIVNTLSTFMDYLVTLNGAPASYVGYVGGTFQALIMCASLVVGGWTDHSRKYYFVILAMLILGAFALAMCNLALDSNEGGDLRMTLLVVAVLAGPLQPISTELGVEVVYPLSENTVLVIQQLFSNLLSAAFIPLFKALRNVGTATSESGIKSMFELPQYTFSFYLLIVMHAVSTCYFATFNGTYLRYNAETAKKELKAEEKQNLLEDLQQQHAAYGSVEPN